MTALDRLTQQFDTSPLGLPVESQAGRVACYVRSLSSHPVTQAIVEIVTPIFVAAYYLSYIVVPSIGLVTLLYAFAVNDAFLLALTTPLGALKVSTLLKAVRIAPLVGLCLTVIAAVAGCAYLYQKYDLADWVVEYQETLEMLRSEDQIVASLGGIENFRKIPRINDGSLKTIEDVEKIDWSQMPREKSVYFGTALDGTPFFLLKEDNLQKRLYYREVRSGDKRSTWLEKWSMIASLPNNRTAKGLPDLMHRVLDAPRRSQIDRAIDAVIARLNQELMSLPKEENQTSPDIQPVNGEQRAHCRVVASYLKRHQFALTIDNALGVLAIADRLQITRLKLICERTLIEDIKRNHAAPKGVKNPSSWQEKAPYLVDAVKSLSLEIV